MIVLRKKTYAISDEEFSTLEQASPTQDAGALRAYDPKSGSDSSIISI